MVVAGDALVQDTEGEAGARLECVVEHNVLQEVQGGRIGAG